MAELRHRVFAGTLALVFLVTSVGFSIFVIIQGNSSSSNSSSSSSTNSSTQNTMLPNFTPVSSVPSLTIKDLTAGTGQTVAAGDTINVKYSGALASTGIIFQSSTVSISLNSVIKGWQEGVPGMKVGGTRQLLVPSALAYGSTAQPGIPANSNLVFDLTINSIK